MVRKRNDAPGGIGRAPAGALPRSLLAGALVTAVLTACGSTSHGPPKPTPTPPGTPSASPSSSSDPTNAAILNAYTQAENTWHAAAAVPEINYPGLTTWYTGQALVRAQGLLTTYVQLGEIETGTRQLHPQLISVDGTTATVQDCLYSTAVLVYKASGSPAPGQANGSQPEWDLVTATLVDTSGTWQVSAEQEAFGSTCRPAS